MILVIGEKPSVGMALAKVLGAGNRKNGYLEGKDVLVSWCLGHLAEYAMPEAYGEQYQKWDFSDLPIIPEQWKLVIAGEKKEQYEILKGLLNRNDVEYVVNGCDAGREGELIFRRVYDLSGSRIPVRRLWISSMEDQAVREGFEHLKDAQEYADLCAASICRAQADWLVGMNATRAFTTKYFKKLLVGRVQTPTLAMLVERQDRISNFVKEAFFKAALSGSRLLALSGNMDSEAECDALVERCQGKPAVVSKVKKTVRKTAPPKLYDLTTLQREANRFFGYTAQETLKELQTLYEAKLVTYPRTDSQYITSDMKLTAYELLGKLPSALPFLPAGCIRRNVDNIVNDAKVTDHHALLPTKEAMAKDWNVLPEKQKNIMVLIAQRLAQAVSEDHVFEDTDAEVQCEGTAFKAKGKKILQAGFRQIEDAFRKEYQKGNRDGERPESEGSVLPPELFEGMEIPHVSMEKIRHFTSPPQPYTEDTLLLAMERAGNKEFDVDTEKKGLGTPATRAGIIEKLIRSGYAVRKGKQIIPTKDGCDLVGVLPDYLKSPSMTAEWENRLLQMERGQLDGVVFMKEIMELIDRMLAECSQIPAEELNRFHPKEKIGVCPVCGSPVYEGKKNFYCSNRECAFTLWKESRYLTGMKKTIDRRMAQELLSSGRTRVTDFYSQKKGRNFTADLLMEASDGRANFRLEFPKKKGNGSGKVKKQA